jgi:hypothetical protein
MEGTMADITIKLFHPVNISNGTVSKRCATLNPNSRWGRAFEWLRENVRSRPGWRGPATVVTEACARKTAERAKAAGFSVGWEVKQRPTKAEVEKIVREAVAFMRRAAIGRNAFRAATN